MNILLSMFYHKQGWNNILEKVLEKKKVAILAFTAPEEFERSKDDWEKLSGKEGKFSREIILAFESFGVSVDDMVWLNYFDDTLPNLVKKLEESQVLFIPGGAPDEAYNRIVNQGLLDILKKYEGTIIGFSAGAMLQIDEFHITPDDHYPEYCYHEGLGYITDFDVEVHFENEAIQRSAIERVLRETNKSVYAIGDKGLLMKDGEKVTCFGDVQHFI